MKVRLKSNKKATVEVNAAPSVDTIKPQPPTVQLNSATCKGIGDLTPGAKCKILIDAEVTSLGVGSDRWDSKGKGHWAALDIKSAKIVTDRKNYEGVAKEARESLKKEY